MTSNLSSLVVAFSEISPLAFKPSLGNRSNLSTCCKVPSLLLSVEILSVLSQDHLSRPPALDAETSTLKQRRGTRKLPLLPMNRLGLMTPMTTKITAQMTPLSATVPMSLPPQRQQRQQLQRHQPPQRRQHQPRLLLLFGIDSAPPAVTLLPLHVPSFAVINKNAKIPNLLVINSFPRDARLFPFLVCHKFSRGLNPPFLV